MMTTSIKKYQCKHGESRYDCIDCGSSICEHKRRRRRCKECGGSGICEHKRIHFVATKIEQYFFIIQI